MDEPIDRISQLPDDILSNIISSLTLKESTASSLLSTRWKDLWKFYSGYFDFDDASATPYPDCSEQWSDAQRDEFVNSVNKVLLSHDKATTIRRLRLIMNLSSSFHPLMDEWIHLASSKSVQCLDLNFSLSTRNNTIWSSDSSSSSYTFPSASRFCSLTTLSLTHVQISGETLEALLADCLHLEELNITHSIALQSFKLYSLSLKKLTIWFCGDADKPVDRRISTPNIWSLSCALYRSHNSNLVLEEDVPKLQYLSTGCHRCHFRDHLSQLTELVLHRLTCSCCATQSVNEPEMPNLKSLTIKDFESITIDDFSRFVALLKAAPLLEILTLEDSEEMSRNQMDDTPWKMEEAHHYPNLKKVKLVGYSSRKFYPVIRYFMSYAPRLEAILVDPCDPLDLGTPGEISYRQSETYSNDHCFFTGMASEEEFSNIVTVVGDCVP
ncbi:hypothetical protein ACFE04_024563 [Oxalis oulophora]